MELKLSSWSDIYGEFSSAHKEDFEYNTELDSLWFYEIRGSRAHKAKVLLTKTSFVEFIPNVCQENIPFIIKYLCVLFIY